MAIMTKHLLGDFFCRCLVQQTEQKLATVHVDVKMSFSWKPFPDVKGQWHAAQSNSQPPCFQSNASTNLQGQRSVAIKPRTAVLTNTRLQGTRIKLITST